MEGVIGGVTIHLKDQSAVVLPGIYLTDATVVRATVSSTACYI